MAMTIFVVVVVTEAVATITIVIVMNLTTLVLGYVFVRLLCLSIIIYNLHTTQKPWSIVLYRVH